MFLHGNVGSLGNTEASSVISEKLFCYDVNIFVAKEWKMNEFQVISKRLLLYHTLDADGTQEAAKNTLP